MISKIKKYVLSLLLSTLLPAMSYGQSAWQITGRVVNASRDSAAVHRANVQLVGMRGHSSETFELQTTLSAKDGSFRFSMLEPDSTLTFFAIAAHHGVNYFSDGFTVLSAPDKGEVKVTVYDTTRSVQAIAGLMHHIFVEDHGDVLFLRETRVFGNESRLAIINVYPVHDQVNAVLRYPLPQNVINFTSLSERFGIQLHKVAQIVYDAGIFVPGTRQNTFSYELPWENNDAHFILELPYATRSFDVFIDETAGLTLESPQLENMGPFTIRGTSYGRYNSTEVAPGSKFHITVRRSGAPIAQPSQSPLLPIALTTVLLLAALSVYRMRRPSESGTTLSDTARLEAQKGQLLHEIAVLENQPAFQENKNLRDRRDELYDELRTIDLLLLSKQGRSKTIKKR